MVYKFKPGSRLTGDAQAAGEICAALESEGRLTAAELVEVSRPESAPLHNMFEWRDGVAAEKWREYQGRNIIHSIVVVPEDQKPQQIYYNVTQSSPIYDSIKTIVQSEDKYALLKRRAAQELVAFQNRYSTILELSNVFDAINNFLAEEQEEETENET